MFQRLFFALLFAAAMTGCATVPMGDTKEDARLKSFSARPQTAGIYVYRNETMGAAIRMDVDVDGFALGQTAANTYLYTDVAPGRHVVTSKAENTDNVEINAVAGKLYYIWQEVKMGFGSARNKLHLVDEAEGRKGVASTRLASSTPHPSATRHLQADMHRRPSTSSGAAPAAMQDAPKMQAALQRNEFLPMEPKFASQSREGISSFTVEKMGRKLGCHGSAAMMVRKEGPVEDYELQCNDRRVLRTSCEYRQCKALQ
jgi:hypothetical protein